MDLVIDPVISGAQRKLTPEEFGQLEENILRDGEIRDKVVVWKGTAKIVDGENRYTIAKKHNLSFDVQEYEFADEKEVIAWIYKTQLGRRNLEGIAASLMRGKLATSPEDIEKVAEAFNVSERTVYRDKEVVQVVSEMPDDLRERIDKGSLVASDNAVRKLKHLDESSKAKVYDELRKDRTKSIAEALPSKKQKVALTDEESDVLKRLSPKARRMVEFQDVTSSSGDIRKLDRLTPELIDIVSGVLETGDVADLGEAIEMLGAKKPKRPDATVDVDKLRNKIADAFAIIRRTVDDLGLALGKNVEAVHDALKIAESNVP